MALTELGSPIGFVQGVRIERLNGGALGILDINLGAGSLFSLAAGGELRTLATGIGQWGDFEILNDGALLLYRQTSQFGGAMFRVHNPDGSLRTGDSNPLYTGSGDRAGIGPVAVAAPGGGFFFGYTDRHNGNEQVPITYPPDQFGGTSGVTPRGDDAGYRFFNGAYQGGAFEVADTDIESVNGATTSRVAGLQNMAAAVSLANGGTAFAFIDDRAVGRSGGFAYQRTISLQIATATSPGEPVPVNTEPLNTGDIFNPDTYRVDGIGGVRLVSLGAQGVAAIWHEQNRVADSSVFGGYRLDGYDIRIRYFSLEGSPLTDEITLYRRPGTIDARAYGIAAEAMPDGSIVMLFEDSGGASTRQLFLQEVGPLGTTSSVMAIGPVRAGDYADFDLVHLGDGRVAISYQDPVEGYRVRTFVTHAGTDQVVNGGADPDQIITGIGHDWVRGEGGNDTLDTGAGNDRLFGGDGADTLDAGADNDLLDGGADSDLLFGRGGDDMLIGGPAASGGFNQLWGGEGSDTASYEGATGNVTVDLRGLYGLVDSVLTDTMNSIENVAGGSGNDLLIGTDGSNALDGAAGNDVLFGLAGDDVLTGGNAAGGFNQLWGGEDADTASYAGLGASVYASVEGLGAFVDVGAGYSLLDTYNSIENLVGSARADILVGNGGANVLTGSRGADILYGRAGADTFVYRSADDSSLAAGYDTIADFQTGSDKLDLSALRLTLGQVLIVSDGGSTALYADINTGTAGYELAVSLVGANAVTTSDLLL